MRERRKSKVSSNQKKEFRNNEKGSIVLYVIIAMIFFLIIVFNIYINVKNKFYAQEAEINKIILSYNVIPDIPDLGDNVYINLYKEDGETYSTEEWTNNDITVEAVYPEKVKSDSKLISLDGGKTFKVYSGRETITENTTIIAKVKEVTSNYDKKIISRIDKILPTYTSTAKKQYMIPDKEVSVDLDINIIATDGKIEKSSGINTSLLSYAWGSSETEEPAKWTPITEYTQDGQNITFNITKEKTIKGTYYLWLNIQDKAGNKAGKRCITIDVIEPVAKIGDVIYGSLQSAINACATDGTETTIVMLRSVEERVITKEGQNIILQLDGKTITNKSTDIPAIINYARLTILDDNTDELGGINSSYIGIENKETGNLTLGVDDDDVSQEKPKISGKTMAITNNEGGTFSFFDGILTGGEKAIIGNINYTPVDFKTISTKTETSEMAYLGILADPVAKIEDIYYGTLKNAISSSRKQETITILRGLSTEESIEIPEDKDVKMDLNGYIITTTISDYTLKNYGTLELKDLVGKGSFTSTTNNTIYNGKTGNLKINGATININKSGENSAIYNDKGNVEVLSGTVTASNSNTIGIHNHAGTVNVNGGEIKATGSNTKGIYNESVTEKVVSQESSQIEIGDLKENGKYYFVKEGDTLVSNNAGVKSSVAQSYIKIDLTKYTEDKLIDVIVNAQISSEKNCDIGYATITNDTSAPKFNDENGRFMYISGTANSQDYTTTIKGGDIYYLHFGYKKDRGGNTGSDKLTINSVSFAIFDEITTMGNVNVNGGTVSAENRYSTSIYNGINGIVNINDGTIKYRGGSSSCYAINNNSNGVINLKGGTININTSYGIYNYSTGKVNVTGGKIKNYNGDKNGNGIYNNSTGVVKVEAGEMDAIYQNGTGEMSITGGTLGTITNNNTETIEVKNATIKNIQNSNNGGFKVINCTIDNTIGVQNTKGTIEINGSKIKNTTNNTTIYGVRNFNGTITINDSEIDLNSTTNLYGIDNNQNGTININNSSIKVTNNSKSSSAYGIYNNQDGNINVIKSNIIAIRNTNSTSSYGIYNKENGNITIGNKNDNSDIEEITITGTTAGVLNNNGVLNFYDGTITGTKAIDGYVADIEENYNIEISKTDELEKAILTNEQYDVVEIVETGIKYNSLQDALKACSNDAGENVSTIRVLKTPLYVSNTEINIEDGQNIKLDINGKDIWFGKNIINNGIFVIDDTSETKGNIILNSIINNKNLSINNGTLYLKTSLTGIYNAKNCNLEINGGTISLEGEGTQNSYKQAILNEGGTIRITGGTISLNSSSSKGIKNINSFNGIEANGEYYFEEKEGKLVSNNSAKVYGNSYVKIDLTGKEGIYNVKINTTGNHYYSTSSGSSIKCYATIRENTTAPTETDTEGRFMYYDGVYTDEYDETTIEGGKVYYLHFGNIWTGSGDATKNNMVVNSIQVYNESEELNIQNTGKVYIEGGRIQTEGVGTLIDNAGYMEMTTGDLVGGATVINNKDLGKVVLNGGNITGKKIGINTTGKKSEIEINDIDMKISLTARESGAQGIYSQGGNIQINGGTITVEGTTYYSSAYGIYDNGYNNQEIRMTGGKINVEGYNRASGISSSGNIEILGGKINATARFYEAYGIYTNKGNITLGTKDKKVSTETPSISGKTNGIYNNNGNLFFYDGVVIGPVSIYGQITSVEPHYGITISTDSDSNQYSTLVLVPTDDATAFVNGNYYNDIQSAIDACGTDRKYYVVMMNGANISSSLNIDSTKDIVLDLGGFTITSALDYTIINDGILTIIDSEDSTGVIKNTLGTVIKNNGTLTIGKDDRVVSTTAPCIEANIYGVENGSSNEMNFYDGIIKSVKKCIYLGTILVPNKYNTAEEILDGINITTLKIDE